jgi:citrate synthase
MDEQPEIHKGLDGVYVSESTICKVDGAQGRLYYRGYPIEDIAKNSSYEEASYLLLNGKLPTKSELEDFSAKLKAERELPDKIINLIIESASKSDPMDILRTAVSYLSIYDGDTKTQTKEANIKKAIKLISKTSSIVATIGAAMNGKGYTKPDLSLSHSENFIYMLKGEKPTPDEVKPIEMMFILQAEHSTNASTFATMVAGSTLADLYSAATAGISALKGPLHGGADEEALKMMEAIGDPSNTESYINDALAGKKKIMGFGHRVYKTYDPRAKIIKGYLLTLQQNPSPEIKKLTEIALRGEKLMIDKLGKTHGIWPNVDFFAGPVYVSVGIKVDLFTPLFAASRMAGWCAHMIEYWEDNKLIRPLELYKGEIDKKYLPISER